MMKYVELVCMGSKQPEEFVNVSATDGIDRKKGLTE
jgi:hypothetical protein